MGSHRIETSSFAVEVTGARHPALDAITANYGSYKRGVYTFPKSAERLVRDALDNINNTPAEAAANQGSTRPTGWSKAARRRAGNTGSSHPLGTAVERGDGYTTYEDEAFGGGRVQIWDES